MNQNVTRIGVFASLFLLLSSVTWAADEGFPGRKKYPDIPYLSIEQLKERFAEVVIVDARSKLEYETLRINGAKNIPVANERFLERVIKLRSTTDKMIVFYCNGRTCMKSYHAVKKAKKGKVKNIIAYDAGMFEWAKAYPDLASLFGESPVPSSKIISKKKFKSHTLSPGDFVKKAYKLEKVSLVLDIRDKYQRSAVGLFPIKERWASLDDRKRLDKYIALAKRENRPLFIYDEVGKQVRWLQYALEKHKIRNYYFMETGAKGYYKTVLKEMGFPNPSALRRRPSKP